MGVCHQRMAPPPEGGKRLAVPGLRHADGALKLHAMNPLRHLRRLRDERRRLGWSGFLKGRGWKVVLLLLVVYLVRDLVLYVLVPLAIIAGLKR